MCRHFDVNTDLFYTHAYDRNDDEDHRAPHYSTEWKNNATVVGWVTERARRSPIMTHKIPTKERSVDRTSAGLHESYGHPVGRLEQHENFLLQKWQQIKLNNILGVHGAVKSFLDKHEKRELCLQGTI